MLARSQEALNVDRTKTYKLTGRLCTNIRADCSPVRLLVAPSNWIATNAAYGGFVIREGRVRHFSFHVFDAVSPTSSQGRRCDFISTKCRPYAFQLCIANRVLRAIRRNK